MVKITEKQLVDQVIHLDNMEPAGFVNEIVILSQYRGLARQLAMASQQRVQMIDNLTVTVRQLQMEKESLLAKVRALEERAATAAPDGNVKLGDSAPSEDVPVSD